MASLGGRVSFSPSGSNSKNKNKSPMLIPILFHEVIINKCICHGFYFVHCIQFSQLSDLDIVRSCAQEYRSSRRQVESATSNSATTAVNSATISVKSATFANRLGDNFGHIGDTFCLNPDLVFRCS